MRKQLEDFLINITDFYPISSNKNFDNVIAQSLDYLLQFCCGKEIDFKKARNYVFENYKSKGFPDLALLKESIICSEIKKTKTCEDEGCLVVLRTGGNHIYGFKVSTTGRSLEDIKKDATARFGNVKVETYPKGSVLIGDKVFLPD